MTKSHRRLCAGALIAWLALAPSAAAQDAPKTLPPPPAGLGEPPPGALDPTPPPAIGNTPPPVIEPTPSATTPGVTAPNTRPPADGETPSPGTEPAPAAVVGGGSLRGRVLEVRLSCTGDGSVRVTYRKRRISASRFKCARGRATARMRLSRKVVRTLKRNRRARLEVTARVGDFVTRRTVRPRRARARAALWQTGIGGTFDASASCGASDEDPARVTYRFSGELNSLSPDDYYWFKFWAYTWDGAGWQQTTDWWGPHPIRLDPELSFIASGPLFSPARGYWTAGYMEIWSYRAGRSVSDYLLVNSSGNQALARTSGVWCLALA